MNLRSAANICTTTTVWMHAHIFAPMQMYRLRMTPYVRGLTVRSNIAATQDDLTPVELHTSTQHVGPVIDRKVKKGRKFPSMFFSDTNKKTKLTLNCPPLQTQIQTL